MAMIVAISLRANHTPGAFLGTALFSGRSRISHAAAANPDRADGTVETPETKVLVDLVMS